jgi:ribosomal protein S18 acetylase RimI-like enzyme
MKIRPMVMTDYPVVINLWKNTENIGISDADNPEQVKLFLERNPGLCFVALKDDQIIGAVLGGHDGRRGAIYHLAVRLDFRGQGYGSALLEHCLAGFASIGIERCHIHVYADNLAGLEFWQKHGWFLRPELVLLSKDINKS